MPTTNWGLRFPGASAAPNVPLDIQNLATDVDISLPRSGTLEARSGVTHHVALFYYATDTGQLFMSDGSTWIEIPIGNPGIPIGAMLNYGGTGDPADTRFLLADGRIITPRTGVNAPLFAVIGTSYNVGGEAGTEFRIPDQRGRVSVGQDNMGTAVGAAGRIPNTNRVKGQSHGEERHLISLGEMPMHDHGGGNHRHGINASNDLSGNFATPAYADGGFFNLTEFSGNIISVQGSNLPHNIIQPGQVNNVLIRVK